MGEAAFHPDSRQVLLAGGGEDISGEARLWRIPPYPEPQPALQPTPIARQIAAIALPLAALLPALVAWLLGPRRLRQRLDRLAPQRQPKVISATGFAKAKSSMQAIGEVTKPASPMKQE